MEHLSSHKLTHLLTHKRNTIQLHITPSFPAFLLSLHHFPPPPQLLAPLLTMTRAHEKRGRGEECVTSLFCETGKISCVSQNKRSKVRLHVQPSIFHTYLVKPRGRDIQQEGLLIRQAKILLSLQLSLRVACSFVPPIFLNRSCA